VRLIMKAAMASYCLVNKLMIFFLFFYMKLLIDDLKFENDGTISVCLHCYLFCAFLSSLDQYFFHCVVSMRNVAFYAEYIINY